MSNLKNIKNKLEAFIKRYYTNELIRGIILFFAIGLLYFLFILFIEHTLWLKPFARTVLFFLFLAVEIILFVRFIIIPLTYLFKLKKGINYFKASKIIGSHFPEVNDKLLNLLQLEQGEQQSDLLIASIEQKSLELQPVPFKRVVNFMSNTKYLKYAGLPILILLISFISGKTDWFNSSYQRVVNYETAYQPPAPFQFLISNKNLLTVESKNFTLNVNTLGSAIPESVQIEYNSQTYYLKKTAAGEFEYEFNKPKESLDFVLKANNVTSQDFTLNVIESPSLVNLNLKLDYPSYTKKKDIVLNGTGTATVPEGTKIIWIANAKSTTKMYIYAKDTLRFNKSKPNVFEAQKRIYNNFNYTVSTSNANLKDYENLSYAIDIIKDALPKLDIEVRKDSLNDNLYFKGKASDDYGLSKIELAYYPVNNEDEKQTVLITKPNTNYSEFLSTFPNQLNLKEGVSYNLYFKATDNDAIHNYKQVKSTVFTYRNLTVAEQASKQLEDQKNTLNSIDSTLDKQKEQDKKLEDFSKTQKEKEALNFNDKQKFQDFLKQQKNQEQLMQRFNKKLQDNLEKQKDNTEELDQFKEDLKKRLKENEEELKKDEELLKELEKLKDKINKEEFAQKLEDLAKQSKNKKRSMKQLLELTKRFYVMKKTEKIKSQLESLSKEQNELSNKGEENTKEAQEKLNKKFDDLQKELTELKEDNRKLQKPVDVPRDEALEESIKEDQKKAKENLEKQDSPQSKENAKDQQQKAAKKMKQMSDMLMEMSGGGGGGGDQMSEDIDMLRQILDNLLRYSFDQESLMNKFNEISINNNNYGKFIVEQNSLREHFEHIDDSLFSLSLRQPKLSENVNKQITEVYFNIDKALNEFSENKHSKGISSQQYTITASNELASFLSDVLDNMEMQMNMQMGQGQGEGMQLPDIIMNQEELNKAMEEGMKKDGDKGQPKDGKEGSKEGESESSNSKDGKQGESSGEGQDGNGEQSNGNGDKKGDEGNGSKKGDKGKSGEGGDKSNDGYGEGGSEELNKQIFSIYQKQQQLRKALEDRVAKQGKSVSVSNLIKAMEDVELDLLNKGFTQKTLDKMMNLQHQLLKLDKATFTQDKENKRESNTNKKEYNGSTNPLDIAKQYFNTTEILNRKALPVKSHIKRKVKTYFIEQ